MTRPRALATCLALSLGACGPGLQAATPGGPPTTEVVAFVHATVIPMDTERALADQTVVVARGRIVAVGPSPGVKVPAGALRVDATGRYLIPALSDMHVHLLGTAWNMMLPPEGRLAAEDVPAERFLSPTSPTASRWSRSFRPRRRTSPSGSGSGAARCSGPGSSWRP